MRSTRTKIIGKGSVVDNPPIEDAPDLRRSRRIGRKPVIYSPEIGDQMFKTKCSRTNKKKLPSPEFVSELRRNILETTDHDNPPEVARDVEPAAHDHPPEVAAVVEPVDITSSPEESKADVNILWMLQPARKPHPKNEIPPENLAKFLEVASILKSDLVSVLTSSAHKMRLVDMIKRANACFTTLATLGDDYRSFYFEICKLIEYYENLESADEERKKWADSELKTRLYKQTDALSDATEKLVAAQNHLSGAVTRRDELRSKIVRLIDEFRAEEEKVEILAAKRDQCKEKHLSAEAEVHTLEKEIGVAFQGVNARFDAAKEGIENVKNHLLHLVKKH